VPSWAEISGNELVEATQAEGEFRFLVRKV
jgi:TusA-related sulfurtransferase